MGMTNEMRSKSSTQLTKVQRLEKKVGFWQDQCGREQEKIKSLKSLLHELANALDNVHNDKCLHLGNWQEVKEALITYQSWLDDKESVEWVG